MSYKKELYRLNQPFQLGFNDYYEYATKVTPQRENKRWKYFADEDDIKYGQLVYIRPRTGNSHHTNRKPRSFTFMDQYGNENVVNLSDDLYYQRTTKRGIPTLFELSQKVVHKNYDLDTLDPDDPRTEIIKKRRGGKTKYKRKKRKSATRKRNSFYR